MSPSLAQTVGYADQYSLPNPHSCHYCGTNPRFDFLLVSLTWFKPGERLSLANRWMCQYPYDKNTGVRTMVQTGGKVTCRNSRTARNDSDELGLDPVVIHVSQPLLESLACCGRPRPRVVIVVQTPPRVTVVVPTPTRVAIDGSNRGRRPPRVAIAGSTPWSYLEGAASSCRNSKTARNDSDQLGLDRGVRYNHWVQPRAVTTRVVIRGRPATSRTLLEGQFDFHVSQLEDGPQPHAARARRVSVLRPAPSSRRYRWPKPLAQTVSDPGIRLRGDLPKWRASSLDWCANPVV